MFDSARRQLPITILVVPSSVKKRGRLRSPASEAIPGGLIYFPVPVRFEICGLLLALSDACTVPVLVPIAVGVNTTLMVQVPPGATLDPQNVEDTLKSPVVEIETPVSVVLRLFLSVNTFAGLVVPTVWDAYFALAGVNVAGGMPLPDSGTICGLFEALSVIVMFPVLVPSWVGVKVAEILQLAPTATVLPQGFVLGFSAKSPLIVMLLMFSVKFPVLVSVTVFAALVTPTTLLPKLREVGDRVTAGPVPVGFTVRLIVVVCVKLPDTPWMVTVTVPVAAEGLAVRVSKLVEVVGFVPNPAVTPLGRPEADKVTLPLNPLIGFTVMVLVPLFPWLMVTLVGFALRLKSGVPPPPQLGKVKLPIAVLQLNPLFCPLTFIYSLEYQKVQSSVGSTVIEV
jgi:hypothetical protein